MNLQEAIKYVGDNKQRAAIFVKKIGSVTFSMCKQLIDAGLLNNDGNRDEDLDTKVKYYGKVHHLIRYMSGISEKGQLLVSILKDVPTRIGYIRDNGTMFSLTFGKYYDNKVLTGTEWLIMCDDIVLHYDINNEDDKYVIQLIRTFFENKKDEQLDYAYSLKEVVESSDEFKEFYDNIEIGFVVSLQTVRQFEKDMMNCNRQPNPWLAYNYYMTPLKRTSEYHQHYCGDKLLEFFTNKEGADIFSKGKLMNGHSSYANTHKVAKMIPILQSYIGSQFCDSIDDLKKFNSMVVSFENGKDDGKETQYWRDMFKKTITDASYKNMTDFYEKQYKLVFESEDWSTITQTITKLVDDKNKINGSTIQSMEDLHIKKYHTGILMLTMVLFFKRKNPKIGIAKLTSKVVSEFARLLNGDVNVDNEKVPVWQYFGTKRDFYKSTSADVRWDKIFQYVFKNVESDIKNRSKDRDLQSQYRDNVLKRTAAFLESETIIPRLKLYPLSTDNICSINLSTGDGVQWLHKTPHSSGGNAEDGFLGMTDDNLDGNQKFKEWNCTPNEYWIMVAERNEQLINSLVGVEKKQVEASIAVLYQLVDIDLSA